MKNKVMIDLETLGVGSNPVILQIAAVVFNNDEIIDRFDVSVNPTSCESFDMKTEVETLYFWLDEEPLKFKELFIHAMKEGESIWEVLDGLTAFLDKAFTDPDTGEKYCGDIYTCGPLQDIVWLQNAYEVTVKTTPWKYNQPKCYRTVRDLFPQVAYEEVNETPHDALSDAEFQAKHLIKILKSVAK